MEYKFSDRVMSLKPSAIREILKNTSDPNVIPLSAGNPAPQAFPFDAIKEISCDILNNRPIDALQYSLTEGYTPFRQNLKKLLLENYNIGKEFDDILITSGAQQVMDLFTKSICNPHDKIICENPSFIGSLNSFRSYEVELIGVDIESDGISIQGLEKALKENPDTKFIYTIPNFQNPTGITMSLEKRKKVLQLATKYNVMILEDNPYGDLRFKGSDIPSIKSMDEEGIVCYAGSFSKVLAPGLRIGYALLPSVVMAKMVVCKQGEDVHSNIWSQLIANEFITKYDFKKHLLDLKEIYKQKSNLMFELLNKYLKPLGVQYFEVEGGLFVYCKLPNSINMLDFCKKAIENKVAVVPGVAFLTDDSSPCDSFRINFSTPTDEQLKKGIEILAQVVKDML